MCFVYQVASSNNRRGGFVCVLFGHWKFRFLVENVDHDITVLAEFLNDSSDSQVPCLGFDSQCPPLAYLPTHMLAICVLYLQTICCCFHTYTLTWICFVFSRFPWVEPPTRLLSKRRDINSSQHAEIGENWIFNLNFWLTRRCCFCCSAAVSRWFNCVECLLWGEAITRGGNSLASPVREMTFFSNPRSANSVWGRAPILASLFYCRLVLVC